MSSHRHPGIAVTRVAGEGQAAPPREIVARGGPVQARPHPGSAKKTGAALDLFLPLSLLSPHEVHIPFMPLQSARFRTASRTRLARRLGEFTPAVSSFLPFPPFCARPRSPRSLRSRCWIAGPRVTAPARLILVIRNNSLALAI